MFEKKQDSQVLLCPVTCKGYMLFADGIRLGKRPSRIPIPWLVPSRNELDSNG